MDENGFKEGRRQGREGCDLHSNAVSEVVSVTKTVMTKKYLLGSVALSPSDFNKILVTLSYFLSPHPYMYRPPSHTHAHSCSFSPRLPPHFSSGYLSQTWSLLPLWNSDSIVLLCCWFNLSDRLTFGGAHVIAVSSP